MSKFPFEITSHIQGYLEDILYLRNEWRSQAIFYLIKKDKNDKVLTPVQRENNRKFWNYILEKDGAKKISLPKIKELLDIWEKHKQYEIAIARTYDNEQVPIKRYFLQEYKTEQKTIEGLKNLLEQIRRDCAPRPSNRPDDSYFLVRVLNIE